MAMGLFANLLLVLCYYCYLVPYRWILELQYYLSFFDFYPPPHQKYDLT